MCLKIDIHHSAQGLPHFIPLSTINFILLREKKNTKKSFLRSLEYGIKLYIDQGRSVDSAGGGGGGMFFFCSLIG